MVNTEHDDMTPKKNYYYNILNIVVNTEPVAPAFDVWDDYNILNIVVNTELW